MQLLVDKFGYQNIRKNTLNLDLRFYESIGCQSDLGLIKKSSVFKFDFN